MTRAGGRRMPGAPSRWRFLALAILLPGILIAGLIWVRSEASRGEMIRQQARLSYDRRFAAIALLGEINDAETSQRGYVITGDPDFRQRYDTARGDVLSRIDKLTGQFADAPDQRRRMAALRSAAHAKFSEMDEVIRLREASGGDAASERVRDGRGKRLMTRIRHLAADLIHTEIKTGESRVAAFRNRSASVLHSIWLLVGAGSIALAAVLYALWRRRSQQHLSDLAAFDAAERNEAILDSTIDALLILNPSGTIETLNAAAIRMLGYTAEDLLRRDVSIVADIAPGAGSFAKRIGLVDGTLRNNWLTDRQVRHQDGHLIDVDISMGVMELPDGTHVVASLRDISERKRIERLKDDFISTVSHELRSPLTSIIGALRLLGGRTAGQLNEQATRLVEIAEENARRLIRLINDMLDVDRMDSGKLQLTLRNADIRHVVQRGCKGNQGLAEAYHAEIECTVPPVPMLVFCDEDRLIQALTNLTSNALKVTQRGGKVRINCSRKEDPPRCVVCVDDEGPGVPDEFRSRIFGRFERALDAENKAGTGLGLAIAREIVALHGGEIWFEDRPGGGTRFAFSIPALSEARVADGIPPEPKILIVKRDTTITESFRSLLADEGYDCRIASTTEAARRIIKANGLSLVLVDSANPAFDALTAAEELRARYPDEGLAILTHQAGGLGDDPLADLEFVGWIDKPVDPRLLKRSVRVALGHGEDGGPCILHLDDDAGTLEVTAAALKDEGTVVGALTLTEARNLLTHYRPDVAIIDVDLVEGSGLDLLPDLVDRDGRSIPAIVYSAHDISPHSGKDVDAVILKSGASMPYLKAAIRRIINTQNAKRDSQ